MKCNTRSLTYFLAALCLLLLCSCSNKEAQTEEPVATTGDLVTKAAGQEAVQQQLPVRYQNPGFITADDQVDGNLGDDPEEFEIVVGANISSTRGPQPLWDILKRLANLKGMNVSWSSDVDQEVLVDVNISADDNFYKAVDNLLRQVDYFHEVKDNTIIVKFKETKKFYISVPYIKGTYTTTIGGNYLTNREAASGTEGTVKITSDANSFDVWGNIATNLDIILQQWRTTAQTLAVPAPTAENAGSGKAATTVVHATRQRDAGDAYYTIDRSVGLVTVTAPHPLLEKVESYLSSLKKELYRQVMIEAKIIEVFLQDNSRIGLDWSQVLQNLNINSLVEFGTGGLLGQVYPTPFTDPHGTPEDPLTSAFVSTVSVQAVPFTVMLNALNEQGDATVLSNPKITVLNGQPAMISVGTDIAYIKSVSKTQEGSGTSTTSTFSTEVDNVVEGVALGVMASIVDDDSVILHLTPITTNLVGEEIENRQFGDGLEVGLPKVNVREMSTMVKVHNGEMLIIGGLIDSVDAKQGQFAPVVGNIPFIKYLFGVEEKRKEKRELVILLTPRVI